MTADRDLVEEIRANSRALAREWGFLGGPFAGTALSPSAVHALIEIEKGGVSAGELGARLHLEKSSVSRMLRKLVEAGDVDERINEADVRSKVLSLTDRGAQKLAAIHAHARTQVAQALARLRPGQDRAVLKGLQLYTQALALAATRGRPTKPDIEIRTGYQLALIARITQMHALYYARTSGFGQRFEARVAGGLSEFCGRLESPKNQVWTAMHGGEIVGSVAIDGEDLGGTQAHLRWFIVDDSVRGSGAGRRLLDQALAFADEQGFEETHLWTFSGLDAARHLYEALGFVCVEEFVGDQWGKEVMEQRFVRRRAVEVNGL